MAKATAICTCKYCGKEFEKTATKNNRAEADQWEEWAKDHYTKCRECYAKRMAAQEESASSSLDLPEIKGVSDKQIAYADSLRKRYVSRNKSEIEMAQKIIAFSKTEEFAARAAELDMTPEQGLAYEIEGRELQAAYTCLTVLCARDIIDVLNR